MDELIKRYGLQSVLEQLIECLDDRETYIVEVRQGLEEILRKYKGRYG